VRSGASLKVGGEGSIQILSGTSNNGEFILKQDATIELSDSNSLLNIAGDLSIEDNAIFSILGNGYIKFSNPGDDETNNIFCGSGASIVLQGSGQNDKIMEVQQSTVRFPADLVSLSFSNGKIEMGNGKRMLAEDNYPISFNNVKITSDNGIYNAHRSFFLWGQPNTSINNCIFENGKYGLYNYTYNGAALSITNSEFNNNETGLYMYDKGLTLTNCEFNNNTNYGLYADNMSWGSTISYCIFANNSNGAYYKGSTVADLDVESTIFGDNQNHGLKVNGGFDTHVSCTHIYDNTNGIYNQGSKLYLNDGEINTFSGNTKSIYMNTGYLYLYNAHNQLIPASGGYSVYGYISTRTDCLNSENLNCNSNRWFTSPANQSPSFNNNYRTFASGCYPPVAVNLIDNNPFTSNLMCGIINPPIGIGKDILTNTNMISPLLSGNNNDNLSLSEQHEVLMQTSLEEITISECKTLFDNYIELIENTLSSPLIEVKDIQAQALGEIHNVLDSYFNKINRDHLNATFNDMTDELIELNEMLIENIESTDEAIIAYKLDIALLNRMRKLFTQTIMQIEALQFEAEAMPLQSVEIDSWLCHIFAEKLAHEERITPEAFQTAIQECNTAYENNLEQVLNDLFTEIEDTEEIEISYLDISPNPNTGNFTVYLQQGVAGGRLQIVNAHSQPVAQQDVLVNGDSEYSFNGLASGFYTIYYYENNVVVDSESIVVE